MKIFCYVHTYIHTCISKVETIEKKNDLPLTLQASLQHQLVSAVIDSVQISKKTMMTTIPS